MINQTTTIKLPVSITLLKLEMN